MSESLPEEDKKWIVWRGILKASMSMPGAKVDRPSFLRTQLKSHCDQATVEAAIKCRPALVGISAEEIDELADSCIKWHLAQVTAISFAAGLPGGWWIAGTIPADLAQFYWHAVVLCQKLAYLYGWPDLLEEGEIDDETLLRMTLFVGVMMGAHGANRVLAEIAERFSMEVARRLPREALTKYGIYNLAKQVGRWIGVQVTKGSFSRALSRVIPVIGGFVSGSISFIMMKAMTKRLRNHLRTLKFARGDDSGPTVDV